jgi:hypothetical protein
MENIENKYQNGKIYKLVSPHTNKIYIGSTCKTLNKRLYCHRGHYILWKNNNENKYKYITSYNLFNLGNVTIELIELYSCNSKVELHSRERYWINQNKDIVVNKQVPTRTKQEYRQDHIEYYKYLSRKSCQKISICSCGSHYSESHKQRHFKTFKHINSI